MTNAPILADNDRIDTITKETMMTNADPIQITDAAAVKIAELMQAEDNLNLKLRVYIEGGGCSGFQYGFDFIEENEADDMLICKMAVKAADNELKADTTVNVAVDPMSLQYLMGAEIDYKKDLDGERFIIRNPNAQTTCGCGSSFAVE